MRHLTTIMSLLTVCSLTCCTVANGGDSVPFKPKDYTPSKTLRSTTYEPKAYAPKPRTPSKQLDDKPAEYKKITDTKSLADKALEPGKPFQGKAADKQTGVDGTAYTQGQSAFPSTISNDKSFSSQEKKMFLASTNDSPFIVTERPKARNPLLEPRQGIKAPEETTPTKDPTK